MPDMSRTKASASGASTPVCEAALVQGLRENLVEMRMREGYESSGINWDAVRRGMSGL